MLVYYLRGSRRMVSIHKEVLLLAVRRWQCPACGASHDRDVNAARNLLAYGLRTASSAGCQVCGEEGSGGSHKATVAARRL
jgi:putative transposase